MNTPRIKNDYSSSACRNGRVWAVRFTGLCSHGRLQRSPQGWVYGVPGNEQPTPWFSS